MIRDTSVNKEIDYGLGAGDSVLGRGRGLFYAVMTKVAHLPTQPSVPWLLCATSSGVKRLQSSANQDLGTLPYLLLMFYGEVFVY